METYIFHEGALPPGIRLDYEPSIFNLPQFGNLQDPASWVSFHLLDQRRKKAVAGIRFRIEATSARSPGRAPFGSVEFSAGLNPVALYRFIADFEDRLKGKGVTEVVVRNPPHAYDPAKSSLLETFFLNRKYQVQDAEVSTVIPVNDTAFADLIRDSERLRMLQSERAGFTFRKLSPDRLPEIYGFIARCHAEKGYKISISLEELAKFFNAFPGHYHLFAVLDTDVRAAAVSIGVTKNVMYNFLANHEKGYNQLSPSVLLMDGIYQHCRNSGIGLLDLGTSALEGKPNFPLLDFKLHVGGQPTSKFSFYKKIG
ncbi:MAG TPA: GNAT family N-acetyltransferase [Chryseosolibacter sp.]